MDAVDLSTMDLFGGRLLIVADFVFALVFFLRFGFIDAIGLSSDVKSVDPRILIKRSMFLLCVVVRMGDGIFCGLSIFTTVMVHGGVQVLCCERFWLCRYNLGGDEKGGGGWKFFGM